VADDGQACCSDGIDDVPDADCTGNSALLLLQPCIDAREFGSLDCRGGAKENNTHALASAAGVVNCVIIIDSLEQKIRKQRRDFVVDNFPPVRIIFFGRKARHVISKNNVFPRKNFFDGVDACSATKQHGLHDVGIDPATDVRTKSCH
jgi:hypothetical protein